MKNLKILLLLAALFGAVQPNMFAAEPNDFVDAFIGDASASDDGSQDSDEQRRALEDAQDDMIIAGIAFDLRDRECFGCCIKKKAANRLESLNIPNLVFEKKQLVVALKQGDIHEIICILNRFSDSQRFERAGVEDTSTLIKEVFIELRKFHGWTNQKIAWYAAAYKMYLVRLCTPNITNAVVPDDVVDLANKCRQTIINYSNHGRRLVTQSQYPHEEDHLLAEVIFHGPNVTPQQLASRMNALLATGFDLCLPLDFGFGQETLLHLVIKRKDDMLLNILCDQNKPYSRQVAKCMRTKNSDGFLPSDLVNQN
ncbi:MAG: hypothetical protein H6679_02150 [Epsilonproteobacteria bacterium]|nr:hypothetical protein [Campylobacterota bacterium]